MDQFAATQPDHKTEAVDKFQQFFQVLGKGLKIRLETTVRKDLLKSHYDQVCVDDNLALLLIKEMLPEGFSIRNPNAKGDKPDAQTVSLFHPTESNGVELEKEILSSLGDSEPELILNFSKVPEELPILFRRINLKQNIYDKLAIGLVYGRHGEKESFINQDRSGNPFVNLDCYSKTKEWNPLFVKYRLAVAPALKNQEYGYLKIEVRKDESGAITAAINRVSETTVPEFLKTAQTFPK